MTITVTARASVPNANSATQTSVTSSFTPSADSRVVVVAFAQDNSGDDILDITASTTITGWTTTLTRTDIARTEVGFGPNIAFFEGVMGGSPSSGTITVDWDTGTGTGYGCFQVFDMTGTVAVPTHKQLHKIRTETDGGGDTETHTTGSFGAAATTGNTCIVAFGVAIDSTGAAATPSGWTAVGTPQTAVLSTTAIFKRTDFTGTSETCTDLGQTVTNSGSVLMEFEEVASFTTDQEGFRWRNDDGSETTATWAGAQDANVTAPLGANIRLRSLVNTTGDLAVTAFTLRYKLSTDTPYVAVPVGATTTSSNPSVVRSDVAALTTANPSVTFNAAYTPLENDLVILFVSSTTVLGAVVDGSLPAGWVNPLGSGVEVNSDAHGMACFYHLVTAAEQTAVTLTYTATGALDAAETGRVHGVAVRNVNPAAPIDGFNTAFDSANTVTPHVLAGITGSGVLLNNSLVISSVAADGTGTYGSVPGGWTQLQTAGTTQGRWTGTRDALTTVDTNVTATNITPSVGDEYCSITLAVAKPPDVANPVYVATSGNITAGGEATTFQLSAPSGKATSDFVTGRMWDNENGTDTLDVTTDDYTELEWSLQAQSPAADDDIYQFRVYAGANAFTTYTVTPEWTIGAAGGLDVDAGNAAATSTAEQVAAGISPNAAEGAASAAANQPTIAFGKDVAAGNAAVTATAEAPSTSIAPVANVAAATSTAEQPGAGISVNAEAATATASAFDATVSFASILDVSAELAAATSTAGQPSTSLAVNAEASAATVTAEAATAGVSPAAGNAAATATGEALSAGIGALPAEGAATATANQPATSIAVNAENVAATASAHDATISTASLLDVSAQLASATATANDATISGLSTLNVSAGCAETTATADQPAASSAVNAGNAAVTATAEQPTITRGKDVDAGVASVTATAEQPASSLAVNAEFAAIIAEAFDGDALTGADIPGVVTIATIAAPTVTSTVYAATVTATAEIAEVTVS